MKKVYKIRKVQDGGSFGTTFVEIDDVNQIDLSLIVKSIKDRLKQFGDILMEITRGRLQKNDARQGLASIEFQVDVLEDNRSRRRYWSDITLAFRGTSKYMFRSLESGDKYEIAKFVQAMQNKLKQYEGKTIYKNNTIPDSKPRDGWKTYEYELEDDPGVNRLAKKYGVSVDSRRHPAGFFEVIFEGDESKLKMLAKEIERLTGEVPMRDSKPRDGKFMRFSGKSKSAQGYEIRGYCLTSSGRMYAVIYRPRTNDYLVAAGYNQQRGDWDQGYYDFKTEEQAIKKAEQLTKMYDSKPKDSKVKDAQIDVDFWSDYEGSEAKKDAMDFAKKYGCKVIKFKDVGYTYQVIFEGTEQNLKRLLKAGGYDDDFETYKIKDSKVKDRRIKMR